MEIYLFEFILVITIIIFLIPIIYNVNENNQFLFTLISAILFSALSFQSLNIEIITWDTTTTAWKSYHIDDYYLPLGISFIFAIISGLYTFTSFLNLMSLPYQSNEEKYSRKNKKEKQ